MQRLPEKRKPTLAGAGSLENSKCVAAFDTGENSDLLLEIQARRLCGRFTISMPVARRVAELAFSAGRAVA